VCEDLYFLYRQDKITNCVKLATKVTTKKEKKSAARAKQMKKQSGVCGYVIIAMEKRKLTCVGSLSS
jgi:hypothetical protein